MVKSGASHRVPNSNAMTDRSLAPQNEPAAVARLSEEASLLLETVFGHLARCLRFIACISSTRRRTHFIPTPEGQINQPYPHQDQPTSVQSGPRSLISYVKIATGASLFASVHNECAGSIAWMIRTWNSWLLGSICRREKAREIELMRVGQSAAS